MAGDPDQLLPHAEGEKSRQIWAQTPITQVKESLSPCAIAILNLEYRSPQKIHVPTSTTHYNSLVRAAP